MKTQKMHAGIFLLIGLFVLTTNIFSQDTNFYVFICFGQSNMEGQGAIQAQDRTVDSLFQIMEAVDCPNLGRTMGNWYTATPPTCRCYTGLSPADYFGRTMLANLPDSIKVGIVHVSVAGCSIQLFDKNEYQDYATTAPSWMKSIINDYGGNPYGRLVDMAKLAQNDGIIKGILLHQGETNTGDNQWPLKVKKVYDTLVYDLGISNDSIPLLAGELIYTNQGGCCGSMNSIIKTLPQILPNSYVISADGCTATDELHFTSAGYRKLGIRYGVQMLLLLGYEAIYFEPECDDTIGAHLEIRADAEASNGYYVAVTSGIESFPESASDDSNSIKFTFTTTTDSTYHIYGRLKSPANGEYSFWLKIDNGEYLMCNGLATSDWQWIKLQSFDSLTGEHMLTIVYSEEGADLDKICIKNSPIDPAGMGEEAKTICIPDIPTVEVGLNLIETFEGNALEQNYPNPFYGKTNISFEISFDTYVSLKVFSILGEEISELAGKIFTSGKHTLEFDSRNLSKGIYFYILKTDKFSASRKMLLKAE